jgi:hypothetical protein
MTSLAPLQYKFSTSFVDSNLCDTSYLANPFPMYEHVGVDEEAMYGVEVVDVTIPTNCILYEKGVSD